MKRIVGILCVLMLFGFAGESYESDRASHTITIRITSTNQFNIEKKNVFFHKSTDNMLKTQKKDNLSLSNSISWRSSFSNKKITVAADRVSPEPPFFIIINDKGGGKSHKKMTLTHINQEFVSLQNSTRGSCCFFYQLDYDKVEINNNKIHKVIYTMIDKE